LRPGSVVVIPAEVRHSLKASKGVELEFVIFGTPPISIEDERAKPKRG
jgi:mannose-6-phosphate isomerase-like protein (cupin superfamily)